MRSFAALLAVASLRFSHAVILDVSNYEYNGKTSDFARQFYKLHTQNLTENVLAVALTTSNLDSMPEVLERLEKHDLTIEELPPLLQRALLWDSGYVRENDYSTKYVRVYPLCDVGFTKGLAISAANYLAAGCTFDRTCALDGYKRNGVCGLEDISPQIKCVADGVVSSTDSSMWAEGSGGDFVPDPYFVAHIWAGNKVFGIHTARTGDNNEVNYGVCPASAEENGIIIPCLPGKKDDDLYCDPKPSEFVDLWLQEFAESRPKETETPEPSDNSDDEKETEKPTGKEDNSNTAATSTEKEGFNMVLLVPIVGGIVLVAVIIAFVMRRRREQPKVLSPREPLMEETKRTDESNTFNRNFTQNGTGMGTGTGTGTGTGPHRGSVSSLPADSCVILERMLTDDPIVMQKRIPYGELQFVRTLSKGAFGEVWMCFHQDTPLAVKRLLAHKSESFKEIKDFIGEIQLTASLSHPNIIRFKAVAWDSIEDICMALEYLPTGDMLSFLKKQDNVVTWNKEKVFMALGIAKAIQYLHARRPPLIHRDIKAKNVLLTDDLNSKLIDFGVSRDRIQETMTAGVGTPYWTAPEILEGARYTEQSDIYSFGVLLSEIDNANIPYQNMISQATGEPMKALQILNMIVAGSLRPTFSDQCPPRIVRIAELCWDRDANKRPTADRVVELLSGDLDDDQI